MLSRTKVAIIGSGAVGSSIAYAMILRQLPVEILLNDIDAKRAEGEALDLSDSTFVASTTVRSVPASEVGQSDIIVITAGAKQNPGESRANLIDRNYRIMKSVMGSIQPINPKAKIIIVANPVEILCHIAQKLSGLPRNQVFGSGTFLDSARLRLRIAKTLKIHETSIHCYVIGEHGDNQFVAWSSGQAGGASILSFDEFQNADLDAITHEVARKAYEIIDRKGATYYGIGACVANLTESVLYDSARVFPVSCFDPRAQCYVSTPASLGVNGVQRAIEVPMNESEKEAFNKAVTSIKSITDKYD
ncbi:hypothetical protein H4R33_002511 [Dimargaris cristalligena]|uniref:L-lactate dehydrogenase n=1 Tax=Dimargaris cristalligena TaxID=215637 RepID=A0A4V1J4S5_9FUNG|nr:hypothetical protein H4R33_002511 [Dimargaris cristalligena]RKP36579.1 lactate dehydrogenase B [Dimargaris cristalligena]|eukprot:RKP36579.1 lactate dehydrogenase B [Dimargaris cristalligena]